VEGEEVQADMEWATYAQKRKRLVLDSTAGTKALRKSNINS
jgi:hypothetical protein